MAANEPHTYRKAVGDQALSLIAPLGEVRLIGRRAKSVLKLTVPDFVKMSTVPHSRSFGPVDLAKIHVVKVKIEALTKAMVLLQRFAPASKSPSTRA